jgi:hypothetical protein
MPIEPQDPAKLQAWRQALDALVIEMERWSDDRQWITRRDTTEIYEDLTGTYSVPVLTIQTPRGRLMVQPVGLYIAGAGPAGRVDIYGPNLDDFLLTDFDAGWHVLDSNRVQIAHRFDEPTFDSLVQTLTRAA